MPGLLPVPRINSNGDVIDHLQRPLARREELTNLAVDYATVPANSTFVLTKAGSFWPGVPTTRTDLVFIWKGADPSPPIVSSRTLGTPGMLDGVDIRMLI